MIQVRLPSLKIILVLSTILGGFVVTGLYLGFQIDPPAQLHQFSSHAELSKFVQSHHPPQGFWWRWGGSPWGPPTFALEDSSQTLSGTSGYSTTNIQVEGVDEPDIVKTDGTYIYTISEERVVVVEAYPAESAQIISWIRPVGDPLALFLWGESRLAIISQTIDGGAGWFPNGIVIEVFDVSQPTSILLLQRISLEGDYISARLIDNYLYCFANQWIIEDNSTILLPSMNIGGVIYTIPAEAIYYDPDTYDWGFNYYHILALDISNPENAPDTETFLGGIGTSTIYASLSNLYLAVSRFDFSSEALSGCSTAIHRFAISDGQVSYEASGEVPGFLINQFALDESAGYLRVATTAWIVNVTASAPLIGRSWTEVSNVYILDQEFNLVGFLEGLAPGESIYSVRFLGSVCYLVTFWQTDPLFVIDLSNPTLPKLQGELVIPGYSDYLHPLGDNQLLGIGKDVVSSESDDWWWYQGLKLSLFNASDPYLPVESAKLVLGVRGTESFALHDHHAVLYHGDEQLLVIPVLLAEYLDNGYHEPWEHGEFVWQGACIFYLDPANATIELSHQITHIEDPTVLKDEYWEWQSHFIMRSLYINDVLYTVSPYKLMFHNMDDFSQLGEIVLGGL